MHDRRRDRGGAAVGATGGGATIAGTGGEATGGAPGVAGMASVAGSGGAIGVGGMINVAGTGGAIGIGGVLGTAGTGTARGMAGAGGGGVGGSPAIAGCTAVPVTPNATQQARNVLCYLYSQYGNHILSGQEESGAEVEISYIFNNTGKYPAIRAFEANGDGAATRCLPYWNAGGLCMFGYHMGAPSTADGYTGSMTAVTGGIDSVLTPGSANNTVFNQRLDALANRLLLVQAGNGVVLFRPFHEAGGTWFWWSKEGGAQYVRLWQYAFNRIVNVKGVRNAIWLLGYDGSPSAAFNPGKDFVDIGGADNYNATGNYSPMTSIFNSARTVFGTTVPIALHECGRSPTPICCSRRRPTGSSSTSGPNPIPRPSAPSPSCKRSTQQLRRHPRRDAEPQMTAVVSAGFPDAHVCRRFAEPHALPASRDGVEELVDRATVLL